jgi:hypothetical protein
LAPVERLVPLRANEATEEVEPAVSCTVPRTVPPRVKVTVPVGGADPVVAFTVAVSCVVAVLEREAGLAVRVVEVAVDAVTVMVRAAVEGANPVLP